MTTKYADACYTVSWNDVLVSRERRVGWWDTSSDTGDEAANLTMILIELIFYGS